MPFLVRLAARMTVLAGRMTSAQVARCILALARLRYPDRWATIALVRRLVRVVDRLACTRVADAACGVGFLLADQDTLPPNHATVLTLWESLASRIAREERLSGADVARILWGFALGRCHSTGALLDVLGCASRALQAATGPPDAMEVAVLVHALAILGPTATAPGSILRDAVATLLSRVVFRSVDDMPALVVELGPPLLMTTLKAMACVVAAGRWYPTCPPSAATVACPSLPPYARRVVPPPPGRAVPRGDDRRRRARQPVDRRPRSLAGPPGRAPPTSDRAASDVRPRR